jgi:hypothetical protein
VPEDYNDLFISYTEPDSETVLVLVKGLEKAGFDTWYYERDSLPGLPYLTQVIENINKARIVMVIISEDSILSTQVYNEITYAHENHKPFMPILKKITHLEFQKKAPDWRMILGAYTTIKIPETGVDQILDKIIRGTEVLLKKNSTNQQTNEEKKEEKFASATIDKKEASERSGKNVFISFSQLDANDFATKLQTLLINHGYSIFVDSAIGPNVNNWDSTIESAIKKSNAFIFIVSPNNMGNYSTGKTELQFAINLNIPIIPITLGKNMQLPLSLARFQTIDNSDYRVMEKNLLTTLYKICSADVSSKSTKNEEMEVFIEPIAKIIHEHNVVLHRSVDSKSPLADPWDLLPERYKESIRREAKDIINKLWRCGYTIRLVTNRPIVPITFRHDEIEIMAMMEHDRWMNAKIDIGWTYGKRDEFKKTHPSLIQWDELSEGDKNKDRQIVKIIPDLLASIDLEIVKVP